MTGFPQILQTVLDTTDARGLAEFYRQLLGSSTGQEMSQLRAYATMSIGWFSPMRKATANLLPAG